MRIDAQTPSNSALRQRVLIVNSQPILRFGLRCVINAESDLSVCGETGSAREAQSLIRKFAPNIVVTDIALQEGDGLELVKYVRARSKVNTLIHTMHDEAIYAARLLAEGARGFLSHKVTPDHFLAAVRRVLNGEIVVSDAASERIPDLAAPDDARRPGRGLDGLSNRELQVLSLMGQGSMTRHIAKTLRLSVKTVESHRQRIKRKLDLSTAAQLMQYAIIWHADGELPARRVQSETCVSVLSPDNKVSTLPG